MIEKQYWRKRLTVAGVDEVGKGCLAGPVYAAAVVFSAAGLAAVPEAFRPLIRDSKKLTKRQREVVKPIIENHALSYGVASASVTEIETIGIQNATYLAMRRALSLITEPFDLVLVDGKCKIGQYKAPQECLVGGDSASASIAAASILAKVTRDEFMAEKALVYTDYGFETHVGYGTRNHLEQIQIKGICPLHRRNFRPIADMVTQAHNP